MPKKVHNCIMCGAPCPECVGGPPKYCSDECKKAALKERTAAKKKAAKPLTQAKLRTLLDYDPTTEEWHWRVKPSRQTNVGDEAGHVDKRDGVRWISIENQLYNARKLAHFYEHGTWPAPGELPKREVARVVEPPSAIRVSPLQDALEAYEDALERELKLTTTLLHRKPLGEVRDEDERAVLIDALEAMMDLAEEILDDPSTLESEREEASQTLEDMKALLREQGALV